MSIHILHNVVVTTRYSFFLWLKLSMDIKFRKDSYSRVVIFATQFSTIAKTHMEKNTARFYLPNWFFGSMKSFNSLLDIFVNCTIYTIHSKWTPKKFRKVLSWKKLQYGESFPNGHSRKRIDPPNDRLHKTPFFSSPIQTLYFYIPVSGQL